MKITKATLAAVATIGLLGVGGLGVAYAATDSSSSGSYPSIVEKIATKFNLNKDEVKEVFEQQRSEHQAEHKQKLEERLTQAVKDGKLTEDQKTKLAAKLNELHKDRQESRQELRQDRQDRREELKTWAEQNGINLEEVMPFGGRPPHGGPAL